MQKDAAMSVVEIRETTVTQDLSGAISDAKLPDDPAEIRLTIQAAVPAFELPLLAQVQGDALKAASSVPRVAEACARHFPSVTLSARQEDCCCGPEYTPAMAVFLRLGMPAINPAFGNVV
jgi:hypothetical protein